jgi:hypothetical protein
MDKAVQPAPAGRRIHYERRRPEETTLYQLVQEHLEAFLTQVEAETGSGLPEFVKEEFDAFLECGILAHGFLRLRCADCAQEKLVAFSCKRRGFCPGGHVRVVRDVAAPDPHRPERAQLTHSVPRGTASLTTLCSHGRCADVVKESGVEYEQRFPT